MPQKEECKKPVIDISDKSASNSNPVIEKRELRSSDFSCDF